MNFSYAEFFRSATGYEPYPYQCRLAANRADYVCVETGLGKTEGLVLGWLWRRLNEPAGEPRRLIYVLPMRSLVEQTVTRVQNMLDRLSSAGVSNLPKVMQVMGGAIGEDWFQIPEDPYIVVGTQDALLSRALNRGYAMSRFQWPMTFGAVNNDAYWVIDEVQLQGIGAVTAMQLQRFRERFGTYGATYTTLASATLDVSWFRSGDAPLQEAAVQRLDEEDLALPSVARIVQARKTISRLSAQSESEVAVAAMENHRAGTLTLVVLNTVGRARAVFRRLQRSAPEADIVLLHSRFRPQERSAHERSLRADIPPQGRIVVATQVVEAGVDVSAATLVTDVAPWSSLVQRFGRCNRRGLDEGARIFWIDAGEPTSRNSAPYTAEELVASRGILQGLEGGDAAPAHLPWHRIERGKGLVLRAPDLLDLFDTSPDLAGHDVDVSPYIRHSEEFTVAVFWRAQPPSSDDPPQRQELCPATVTDMRTLVSDLRARQRSGMVRIANQFASPEAAWSELTADAVRAGIIVWLHVDAGCYDESLGFDPQSSKSVIEISRDIPTGFQDETSCIGGDRGSQTGRLVTIEKHAQDTEREARALTQELTLLGDEADSVTRAALWHDVGKAHDVFQDTMRRSGCPANGLWAKSAGHVGGHERRGFRHELPGALVYLAAHDSSVQTDLEAFLVGAHHGKFRVSAPPFPVPEGNGALQVLGNREGDVLPAVTLGQERSPEITISLAPFRVGSADGTRTWVERVAALRDDPVYGPFRLAYLELVLRLSDWRASKAERKSDE